MEQSNKISKFLQTLCHQIRWKKVHKLISEEIENHITDQKDAYLKQGLDEDTATDKAIEQMGDPVLIGRELDLTHRPKTEWTIILSTAIMVLLGFGIRFLASYEPEIPFLLEKSLFFTIIGIISMAIAYFMDFTAIGKYPKTIFIGLLVLTIGASIISPVIYGRYTYVEFILLLYPTAIAGIIYRLRDKGYLGIILTAMFSMLPIFIGTMTSSISSVFLCGLSLLILITIAIVKGWFHVDKFKALLLLYLPVIATGGIVINKWIADNSYYIHRLLISINPNLDPMGSGYTAIKIRDMISNAKLFTRGGLSLNSHMVANINTDYILTYLIHRLGWISFAMIMGVIAFLIIRGFILSGKQKSVLGGLVSTAVIITFTMEVVLYTISNLGFTLFSPGTLPFISYGGMSTVINMILIGIMLSVFRTGEIVRDDIGVWQATNKLINIVDGKIIIDLNLR